VLIITGVVFLSNPKSSTPIKTTIEETTPTTTETLSDNVVESINKSKFILLVYEVDMPYLEYQPSYYTPMNVLVEEAYYLNWARGEMPSEVMEIQNFNEDTAYKLLDENEKFVKVLPEQFEKDVELYVKNYSYKYELLNNRVKIVKRHYLSFDSYADASIKRQEIFKQKLK